MSNTNSDQLRGEGSGMGYTFDIKTRVEALKEANKEAKEEFRISSDNIKKWVLGWGIASSIALLLLVTYSVIMYNCGYKNCWSDREFIYKLIFRIILAIGLLTALAFCIKMLRSHIHLYQYNKYKSTIVNSIPSLIGSTDSPKDVHAKLMDVLLDFGNSGIEKKQKSELNLKQVQEIVKLFSNKSE